MPGENYGEGLMSGMLAMVGATLVGGLGWWIGARFGIMWATIVSGFGTGVGVYYGRRLARHLGGN